MVEVICASADLFGGGFSLLARYMNGSYKECRSKADTSDSRSFSLRAHACEIVSQQGVGQNYIT